MQSFLSIELTPSGVCAVRRKLPDKLASNALVIRPLRVGVCRSDLKELIGSRAVRSDFGHEIVGLIDSRSPSPAIAPRSIVGFDPHVNIDRTGGFTELMIARGNIEALNAAFPTLPPGLLLDRAVFIEPMACAYHSIGRLAQTFAETGQGACQGAHVAILGAGLAGTLQALILKHVGVIPTLFNRDAGRLAMLAERQLFMPHELLPMELGLDAVYQAVIISTSFIVPSVLRRALAMLKPNGILLLFGGTHPDMSGHELASEIDEIRRQQKLKAVDLEGKRVWLAGTYGATTHDFIEAIALIRTGPNSIPVERLITERVGLDQLAQRLTELARSEISPPGKVIVDICAASNDTTRVNISTV